MNRRFLAAFFLVLVPVSVVAADDFKTATPAELAMKDVAMAPGAPAVILDLIQRTDDTNQRSSEYVRTKVLTDEGKKYGDVSITYVPLLFNVEHLKARVTKPDGTVVPFTGKVYEKVVVKVGGVRLISKTFTLPDVQPGSILEYTYDLGYRGNYIYDSDFTVQREVPVLHELLWLRPYTRGPYSTFFIYGGLPPGKAPQKVGDHFELELENIAAFEAEPFAPPENEIKPAVRFFYASGNIDMTTFWNTVAKSTTESVERFIGDHGAVREAAQQAIAGATTPEEKLRKLYARAQQVRNLTFEPEKTAQEERELRENRSAVDVLKNGYGWRDEINRFFVALARGAGFEAAVVRVGDRSERFLSKKLPIRGQLNNEIAGVIVDGKVRLLDPSSPHAPFGMLSWEKTHVHGIKIDKKATTATWIDVPEDKPDAALMKRVAKLRLDGESLKGTVAVTYSGHEAMAVRRQQRNHDDEAAKKAIEEAIQGWFFNGSSVKLTKLTGLRAVEEPIVVELDVTLPSTGAATGSRMLLPLSIFSATAKSPFSSERRKNDVYFEYDHRVDDDVTMEVPAGYSVEALPKAASVDLGALGYQTRYDQAPAGSVHLVRSFRVETQFIDVAKYSAARNFFSQVAAADQEQLVLRKAAK